MDHPHIAKLLDAGTTDAGQPYFVMELVKGIPLAEYCDAHKLNIQHRLGLFQQICSAVQHAHQKGIIHRDLKPTNILVESHDGKPVPKVIDFGLAKATSGLQLTEHSLFTAFGSVMGTPLYMAPEQANFNAIDVDTRADIYALGIILYELLTGTTPLTRDTMKKAALDEMLRLVREQEAPTPSSRLSSSDSKPSVAANRQTEPAKLGRFVKGELDWIVMKALSKERDRRYETANGFAKDIERFLNHEPVAAGPPSVRYKLRKFVRRNRGQVIAASLVLLALVAGMAGTTFGLFRAEAARKAESEQREIAQEHERVALKAAEEERRAKEREVAQRAIAVEQRTKAEKARDRTRDVLDAMTSGVTGDSLATQKAITDEQKKFLVEVLTYYKELAGEKTNDEQSRASTAAAAIRVGLIESRLGRKKQGRAAFQKARDVYQTLAADFPAVPAYRQKLATNHNDLGVMLNALGKPVEAEEQYRQTLAIQEKLAADFPTVPAYKQYLALIHINLGALLAGLGKREGARAEYQAAHDLQKKLVEEFPAVPAYKHCLATIHNNLGALLADLEKREEARAEYLAARDLQKKLVEQFPAEPDYKQSLATTHNNLGNLHDYLGKREEGRAEYQSARDLQKKLVEQFPAMPAFQQELARTHNNLAILLDGLGKHEEARAESQAARNLQKKLVEQFPAVPAYQIELGGNLWIYGILVRDDGKPAESLEWFDLAIRYLTPVHDKEPRDVLAKHFLRNSHWNRAITYDRLQKPAQAVKDWDRAIELSPPAKQWGDRASRATSRLQAGIVAEAVAEVAELTKSSNWNAGQWYDFACVYAVASGKIADKKQEGADRAMELLHKAVQAGYKDAAHMAKDTDLDPLREREDFKKLLAELEKMPKKK